MSCLIYMQVLYSWAVVPTLLNVGGGNGRPVFEDVWKAVKETLDTGTRSMRKPRSHGFFSAAAW